jgi:signal transduction histidine kinase
MPAASEATALVRSSLSPALATDALGCVVVANDALLQCLAMDSAEIVGTELAAWVSNPVALREFLGREGPASEFVFRTSARADHCLELVITRRLAGNYLVLAAWDVTRQVLAERALRRAQQHLEKAQRLAEIGSSEIDLQTGSDTWSGELFRIVGIEPRPWSPGIVHLLDFVHPDDRRRVEKALDIARSGRKATPGEIRIRRADGEIRTIYSETDVECDRDGKPLRLLGIFRDVTEQRAAEKRQRDIEHQLLQTQKLEALGTLAAGVAHELNNALVPILALTKMTIWRLPEDSREQTDLITVLQAGEKARDLVKQIVAFSGKEMPKRVAVDLAELTRSAMRLLRESLPKTMILEERIEPVPPVMGDPGQLPQIVINLVVNAVQATPDQTGTVIVEVASASGERLPQRPDRAPGAAVRISIIDQGCGMDKATLARVFEPFFTTKQVGTGKGLGLSVVHGIVTQHGGRTAVESQIGRGTRFDIYLPASTSAEKTPA